MGWQFLLGSYRPGGPQKVASTCQDVVKRCQVYPSFILRESVYIAGCFVGRRAAVLCGYSPGWGSLHHVVRERPGHGCLPMRGGTVDPKMCHYCTWLMKIVSHWVVLFLWNSHCGLSTPLSEKPINGSQNWRCERPESYWDACIGYFL